MEAEQMEEGKRINRGDFLKGSAAVAAGLAVGVSARPAWARKGISVEALSAYTAADIDWQQAKGQKIRAAFLMNPAADAITKELDVFKKLTGIDVEIEHLDWTILQGKVLTALQSKTNQYDVVMNGYYTSPQYYESSWVDDLAPYLHNRSLTDPKWYDQKDIFESAMELVQWKGKTVSLPIYVEAGGLYYRTDLYDKAGLKPPQTIAQYEAHCQELQHSPSVYGTVTRGSKPEAPYTFISYLHSYGAHYIDASWHCRLNSPQGVAALTHYTDELKKWGPPGTASYGFQEVVTAFKTGRTAHLFDVTLFAPGFQLEKTPVTDKFGLALVPRGPKRRSPAFSSIVVSINHASKSKIASWLFIQWMTSKQLSLDSTLKAARGDSPRESTWSDPRVKKLWASKGLDNYRAITLQSLKLASYPEEPNPAGRGYEPRFPGYLQTRDHLGAAISSVLAGDMSPKAALDEATKATNADLKKFGLQK